MWKLKFACIRKLPSSVNTECTEVKHGGPIPAVPGWEAEAGEYQVQGQHGLHTETLSVDR